MIKNILQVLECTTKNFTKKIAYSDSKREVTYSEFLNNSKKIGTYLINNIVNIELKQNKIINNAQAIDTNKSVESSNKIIITKNCNSSIIIFIDKTVNCLESMMGVLYSGNFYTIIDTNSPKERAENIIKTLNPIAIIIDEKNQSKFQKLEIKLNDNCKIIKYEESIKSNIEQEKLDIVRNLQIDTDPMYVLFTSGSTGIPKGAIISHRAVLSYISWVKETFDINENTIFGSQTPFYFSMSITDVFTNMLVGGTFYIIPKIDFSFPINLIKFMNEKRINTIYWVPSALCIIANLGALKEIKLPDLQKVLFAGEVMPMKQLNMWMNALPNCMYANLFGPTETTDICSYYIVDRKFADNETLPIGKHCNNCGLMIIKDDGTEAKFGEQGELYARGSFLAYGYFGNDEKTKSAFVQNPLNNKYPEIVYKTGDIVKYNERGELIYLSRKDYQIKHMGYRIELGEIEKNVYAVDDIILCACIYDDINSNIVLYYQGNIDENELAQKLEKLLLPYMRPNKYIKLQTMPYNSNGKIDRKKLKEMYYKK